MSDLPAETKNISATNLIMQGDSFDRVMRMAEIMASGCEVIDGAELPLECPYLIEFVEYHEIKI